MSIDEHSTIVKLPVWFVLQDAETTRANMSVLTSSYQPAATYLSELIAEVTNLASPGQRVGQCNPYLRSLLLEMIRIIDGDLSMINAATISPFAQVQEAPATYGSGVDWRARSQRQLLPPARQVAIPKKELKSKERRNPPWVLEEILLATEVYLDNGGRVLGPRDKPTIDLSELLNRLPIIPLSMRTEKFRNPEGVGLKLSNIRAADPTRPGGSPHGNKLDGYFWEFLGGDERALRVVVKEIRAKYRVYSSE